ncbi:hypothetical protein GCM10010178_78330 [Lentzea flava]|uniref:Uncharacterized protein n=1 Tax=Lentzea flava TaxID=103732 RepID=A0ABQ2V9G1_9PSEU|nr:hypothetical protein GCM10010178_78330 [Lentzea flava]
MTTSVRMRVFPLEGNEKQAAPLNANTSTVPRVCKQIPLCGHRCEHRSSGAGLGWRLPQRTYQLWGIRHAS